MKNKVILTSDWHVGDKNNSIEHNEDLLDFTDFIVEKAKQDDIKTLYHLGDLFDQRHKLDVNSIQYSIDIIDRLTKAFDKIIVIEGNHDLYYRDNRRVSSVNIFKDKIDIISEPTIIENQMFVPWVISGEEYDKIIKDSKKAKIKYMFGHFEFSGFKMNDNYTMEYGQTHKSLKHIHKLYTGHYHMNQQKDNIEYVGSPFQFDYNDANDFNRGFIILDLDTDQSEFIKYNKIHILSMDNKTFLEQDLSGIENCSVRVVIKEELDIETLDIIKDKLSTGNYRDTKIVFKLPEKQEEKSEIIIGDVENIDDFVLSYIESIENTPNIKKNCLKKIYKKCLD